MTHLSISLLGSFTVTVDGQPATDFDSNKVRALLAYLAVESDRSHRRETLAGMLWPEATDRTAFNNLRYSLSDLRQTIGDRQATPPFLLIAHDSLQFNRASDHALDVTRLEHGLQGEPDDPEALRELTEAVRLYRGWFLEGFSVSGSAPFEEWAVFKREQIGRQALGALNRLASYHERHGDFEQACAFANRQIELEPWQEEAHRQLMRALALSGRRSAALRQYELCRRTLLQELNVEPATETTALYDAIRLQSVQAAIPARLNPYKGPRAFTEADAASFFGRDGDRTRLLDAVRSQPTVMLMGPSACGKTSLVNAGLLPQLRREGGWAIAACRPGAAPFQNLAAGLAPLLGAGEGAASATPLEDLSAELVSGRLGLGQAADRAFARNPRTGRLLIVVDQLEELVDSSTGTAEGRRFLDWLSVAVSAGSASGRNPRPPVVVLLIMREDSLSRLEPWPVLAAAAESAAVPLAAMSREDLEQAVTRPAERLGATLEAGLLQRLVNEAIGQPGGLPLLELVLTELWECRQGAALSHAAYGAIGRFAGVAARHAGSELGKLDAAGQAQARLLLVQLVRPGMDGADVRRTVAVDDLAPEAFPVLGSLIDARLVITSRGPSGQATADLAHDALVRQWSQLKSWVDADREFFSWLEQVRAAWRQWQAGGANDEFLLRGAALEQASAWVRTRGGEVCPSVGQFVLAGETARARQRAQEESRRQVEEERIRALAAAEQANARGQARARRQTMWLGLAAAVMAAWSLLVTGAFVVHWLTSP